MMLSRVALSEVSSALALVAATAAVEFPAALAPFAFFVPLVVALVAVNVELARRFISFVLLIVKLGDLQAAFAPLTFLPVALVTAVAAEAVPFPVYSLVFEFNVIFQMHPPAFFFGSRAKILATALN